MNVRDNENHGGKDIIVTSVTSEPAKKLAYTLLESLAEAEDDVINHRVGPLKHSIDDLRRALLRRD